MRTAADAGILAGCCALLWLLVAPLAARVRWFTRIPLYAIAAAASTAAAGALGKWREHVRLSPAGVGATFGGMCVFWALVGYQGRGQRRGRTADVAVAATASFGETMTSPVPSAADAPGSGDPTAGPTMTRRERRLAHRRRVAVPRRKKGDASDARAHV